MPTRRLARIAACWMLAWFTLYLGAAIASPVVLPGSYDVICSAGGITKLLPGESGSAERGRSLHCPLCMPVAAPPPASAPVPSAEPARPLAYVLRSIPAARLAALTAAPLPARGPPTAS